MSVSELDWIEWSAIDKRCIINPNYQKGKKYIGNLIRTALGEAPLEMRYAADKLGIYHIDDEVVFIAGNRVITRSSAKPSDLNFNLENLSSCLDINDICGEIGKRLTNFRETTANSYIHGRLLDTKFYLQISYMVFLEFCKDSGFISEEDAQDEYGGFKKLLCKLIQEQQERFKPIKAPKEDIDFLKLISKLYKKGKFRLADSVEAFRTDMHDGLIYYECLCLRRDKLEKKLHKISTDIKINDVIKELVDKNALKRVKEKNTVKIFTRNKGEGTHRFYAIWLHMLDK
ncbi:MAG: hypothetical protein NC416_16775 [Eubacterium sp.]|nr:hypothetical protein [Eubacterium sp.]